MERGSIEERDMERGEGRWEKEDSGRRGQKVVGERRTSQEKEKKETAKGRQTDRRGV